MQNAIHNLTQHEIEQEEHKLLSQGYRKASWSDQLNNRQYAIRHYSGNANDFEGDTLYSITYSLD